MHSAARGARGPPRSAGPLRAGSRLRGPRPAPISGVAARRVTGERPQPPVPRTARANPAYTDPMAPRMSPRTSRTATGLSRRRVVECCACRSRAAGDAGADGYGRPGREAGQQAPAEEYAKTAGVHSRGVLLHDEPLQIKKKKSAHPGVEGPGHVYVALCCYGDVEGGRRGIGGLLFALRCAFSHFPLPVCEGDDSRSLRARAKGRDTPRCWVLTAPWPARGAAHPGHHGRGRAPRGLRRSFTVMSGTRVRGARVRTAHERVRGDQQPARRTASCDTDLRFVAAASLASRSVGGLTKYSNLVERLWKGVWQ